MPKDNLEKAFYNFCEFVKKGSKTATDKTIKKMCIDCNIYFKSMDANRVDIQFRKHIGNFKKDVDYFDFVQFVEGPLAEAYMEASGKSYEAAVADLKKKFASGNPQKSRETKVASDAATARLTDVKGYTGAHRSRFDSKGRGRGIAGRRTLVNSINKAGYVTGYKEMGTYDKPPEEPIKGKKKKK